MNKIFDEIVIRGNKIKNRIVMPPMVNFNWSDENGFVVEKHIKHYEARAKGGTGIIIVEATAVNKEGRLRPNQLGIWSDSHIEGFIKITDACHKYGSVILLQIHHGGLISHPAVSKKAYGPSVDSENPRSQSLSVEEIQKITNDFVEAAVRAEKAGFDGVELHGAHMYLLCSFSSSYVNKRNDQYGESVSSRLKFAHDIINGIRSKTKKEFIICYRMGANVPVLSEGINVARELEKYEIDILHVSHAGYLNLPEVPEGFNYNWIVYSGTEIKKHVKIPLIVVNEIKTPERASYLIENNLADFTAIGRDMLTDPEWVHKAENDKNINLCINCKPRCNRYESDELCPRII
jgi:NADPH2 dehydrogenase